MSRLSSMRQVSYRGPRCTILTRTDLPPEAPLIDDTPPGAPAEHPPAADAIGGPEGLATEQEGDVNG